LFFSEKVAWSPDAKCELWESHMFQSSRVAHPTVSDATPTINAPTSILARIALLQCEWPTAL
jgi:hypothetical protein